MVIKSKEYQKSLWLFFLVGIGVVLSLQFYPSLQDLLLDRSKEQLQQQASEHQTSLKSPNTLMKDGEIRKIIREPSSFALQGMNSRIFRDNQLVVQSKIDRIQIQPQKLLFLQLNKVNEVVMNKLRLESYISHSSRSRQNDFGLFSSLGDFLESSHVNMSSKDLTQNLAKQIKKPGGIDKGVIHDFRWKIYRENEPYLSIKSPLVRVSFKNRQIQLINAEIEYLRYKRRIRSKMVEWDDIRKQFKIPYHFVTLYSDGSRREGWYKIILP